MQKGSGSRSSLLWEVERLIEECDTLRNEDFSYGLPQVLLMENVPQVCSEKNKESWNSWLSFLQKKGYSNYWKILSADDYGIPQSRKRCFCISILGDYTYKFPDPIPLTICANDLLDDEVDDKFFVSSDRAQRLLDNLDEGNLKNL